MGRERQRGRKHGERETETERGIKHGERETEREKAWGEERDREGEGMGRRERQRGRKHGWVSMQVWD